ncbi:gluconokinase [Actinomyces sp.]|uniref:gluconokinase n=1 Tax=Actinomyces sp. TaxID=29317 RepID=UPI00289AF358|nr:gluconokinase [Actinomyces sp.]
MPAVTTPLPPPSDIPEARGVPLEQAVEPLVLAMDIGSTSTRACLYDALARPIRKRTAKAAHQFREGADGTAEIDADAVTAEIADVITRVLADLAPGSVRGVAMDTFASSLVCVDAEGSALTPCITYADSRSAPQLAQLRAELDESAVHQAVGARLHTSYHAPRLLWLARTRPDVLARTVRFVSLGEYVYTRLAGVDAAATSTMAWTGLLNRHTGDLDADLLAATGTRREQFAQIVDADSPAEATSPGTGARWPALVGALWFPAIPDGYASNLGVGATDAGTVALSAATSGAMRVIVPGTPEVLPTGLWAYRVSASESIVGGALNDVGRVMTWLESTLAPVEERVLDVALRGNPVPGIPLVLPFLTGERATGWAGNARAVLTGVSSSTGAVDIWRGAVEGVAISYERIFEQLRSVNPDIHQVIASGGVTQHYPATMEVVAQALGFPLRVVDVKRVTMRGTAVFALSVLDPEGQRATVPQSATLQPDHAQKSYYADLRARFDATYRDVVAER